MKSFWIAIFRVAVLLGAVAAALSAHAQSMFRENPGHSGTSNSKAPRQFHRVKWKFPTGDRIVSSPVWDNKVL